MWPFQKRRYLRLRTDSSIENLRILKESEECYLIRQRVHEEDDCGHFLSYTVDRWIEKRNPAVVDVDPAPQNIRPRINTGNSEAFTAI